MKRLVLVGSGEFTPAMEGVDQYLLSLIKEKVVAVIPTAAGREADFKKWIEMGTKHFAKLGALAVGVPVATKLEANDEQFLNELKKVSFVYFSGGDPGHLFDSLKGTKLLKVVLDLYQSEKILAGCSAGAMVMGQYVLANVYDSRKANFKPKWVRSWGLINFSIIPHFDWIEKNRPQLLPQVLKSYPAKVMGIDEDTALVIVDGKAKVMGRGGVIVFEGQKRLVYKNNQQVPV